MKFNLVSLITATALLTAPVTLALPEPVAAASTPEVTLPPPPVVERSLEKRSVPATVLVDGLRYRKCPRTTSDCPAIGQYAKGTHINLVCFTRTDTTVVDGDAGWAKVTNGYWVALAFAHYVTWSAPLPAC